MGLIGAAFGLALDFVALDFTEKVFKDSMKGVSSKKKNKGFGF